MTHLKCPNCSKELQLNHRTYTCSNRHAFDLSKSGYVNLLQAQNSKQHGDDLKMLKSRKDFLDGFYYQKLVQKINEIINEAECLNILDAGCGEGWYCENITGNHHIFGIDISKNACDLSAKRNKNMTFAVASTYDIPLMDNTMDLVYSVFAPFSSLELRRVLKSKGRFLRIFPLENHLIGLKNAIYTNSYLNEVELNHYDGFEFVEQHNVYDTMTLEDNETIKNLFAMTPYIHRTSKLELDRLDNLTSLSTEIAFGIQVYQKK